MQMLLLLACHMTCNSLRCLNRQCWAALAATLARLDFSRPREKRGGQHTLSQSACRCLPRTFARGMNWYLHASITCWRVCFTHSARAAAAW